MIGRRSFITMGALAVGALTLPALGQSIQPDPGWTHPLDPLLKEWDTYLRTIYPHRSVVSGSHRISLEPKYYSLITDGAGWHHRARLDPLMMEPSSDTVRIIWTTQPLNDKRLRHHTYMFIPIMDLSQAGYPLSLLENHVAFSYSQLRSSMAMITT